MRLTFSEGQLLLESGTGDDAQAQETLEATVEGDGIVTGFNPTFRVEGLQVMTDPIVQVAFTQATRPATLCGVPEAGGEPNTAFLYLVLPMRLPG